MSLLTVAVVISLILIMIFTFTNGMHDVSNIIATMISSGAMSPRKALTIASIFEFLGPLLGGSMVAATMASLFSLENIYETLGKNHAIFIVNAGVIGAITWNMITWYFGLPSSSTHALFGGLVGATVLATRDFENVSWGFHNFNLLHPKGFAGIAAALIISPVMGFMMGWILTRLVRFFLKWASPGINEILKKSQVVTASALAFGHSTNAVQKSLGLMAIVLVSGGIFQDFRVPLWVKLLGAAAISAGALSGGWRIMKTVGRGIFRLKPEHGFDTQAASASIILFHSLIGGPVSTTHVVSSTIMGVGSATRKRAVRWEKVKGITLAWFLTLPASMLLGGFFYLIISPVADMISR